MTTSLNDTLSTTNPELTHLVLNLILRTGSCVCTTTDTGLTALALLVAVERTP